MERSCATPKSDALFVSHFGPNRFDARRVCANGFACALIASSIDVMGLWVGAMWS